MSSCVGPIPPEVTTKSYEEDMRRVASMISDSSSDMTSMRLRLMPSEKQYLANQAELVSTVLPPRTSSPMMRQAAVWIWRGLREVVVVEDMVVMVFGGVSGEVGDVAAVAAAAELCR